MWTSFFLLGLVPPLFLSVLLFHPLLSLRRAFFWLSDFVARDSHSHFGLFTAVLSFNPTYADADRGGVLSILQRRMPISWRLSWDATEAPMRFSGASFG